MDPVPKPFYCVEGWRSRYEFWTISSSYFRTYEEAEADIPRYLANCPQVQMCRIVKIYPRDPVETFIN